LDDVAPATLLVPSLDAVVPRKTVTFTDRGAPRHLWNLAALVQIAPFTPAAAELFARFGPIRSWPPASTIPPVPAEPVWQRGLIHQTR